jgi:hypothetical protein
MAADDVMPNGKQHARARAAGIAIGLASILSVGFMAYHPRLHAHSMAEFIEVVQREALIDGIVHGSLIGLMGILMTGYSVLSSRIDSLSARAALIAYGIGAIAGMAAATISGLIVPQFVLPYDGKPHDQLETVRHILGLCQAVNQVCSRMWVVSTALAVVLWSISLVRRAGSARAVGALGLVLGGAPVIALASGYLPMNVHGVLAFVISQTIWSLAIAWLLVRAPGELRA